MNVLVFGGMRTIEGVSVYLVFSQIDLHFEIPLPDASFYLSSHIVSLDRAPPHPLLILLHSSFP